MVRAATIQHAVLKVNNQPCLASFLITKCVEDIAAVKYGREKLEPRLLRAEAFSKYQGSKPSPWKQQEASEHAGLSTWPDQPSTRAITSIFMVVSAFKHVAAYLRASKGCRAISITELQCAFLQVAVELAIPLQPFLMALSHPANPQTSLPYAPASCNKQYGWLHSSTLQICG